jgi:nucleotide-binding universal stress UspA family protein
VKAAPGDTSVTHGHSEGSPLSEELHRFIASVPGTQGVPLSERVEAGDPRECILAVAGAGPFDVIVVGTHGRTGRARSLAGSVAEGLVRTASCPVITVRESA